MDSDMRITAVVKVGTSSITDEEGVIDSSLVAKLCDEVAELRRQGHWVVVVTSGAIAAGLPDLGLGGERRPRDAVTLQAVSAVGQGNLIGTYQRELARHDLVVGQVLLAPLDFFVRAQYLHARGTLTRLLELGVVPVVNENDAIADDEIRFGDNDRIAALVAHLVEADVLVLLTDTPGLLTADPRLDADASLIEEIIEIDKELEGLAGSSIIENRLSIVVQSGQPKVFLDLVLRSPGKHWGRHCDSLTIFLREFVDFIVGRLREECLHRGLIGKYIYHVLA